MGFIAEMRKAMDAYGRRHKAHMVEQWEKQAEKAQASEPRPLTETQLAWQKLQQDRAQQQQQQQQLRQPARQEHAGVSTNPVYTVTWQIRLTSLGNIPLPWATN